MVDEGKGSLVVLTMKVRFSVGLLIIFNGAFFHASSSSSPFHCGIHSLFSAPETCIIIQKSRGMLM